jgi:hypothetical protein
MPTTSNGLPYPLGTDPVANGAQDIQDLAEAVNVAGLWRVRTCTASSTGGTAATASDGVVTVGTANATVTVNNAFSSQFDYYKIIYSGGSGSGTNRMDLQLGSTVTGYVWGLVLGRYDNVGSLSGGSTNDVNWKNVGFTEPDGNLCEIELSNPFLTKKTGIRSQHWDSRFGGGTGFGTLGGHLRNTTSYTGFTFSLISGTFTGGQIRVYGYAK